MAAILVMWPQPFEQTFWVPWKGKWGNFAGLVPTMISCWRSIFRSQNRDCKGPMDTVESTATRIFLQTAVSKTKNINPHLPSRPVHPYQLEESISNFGGVWHTFFIFILFRIDVPVSKQWSPWSDAMFCGVWSGSALFAYIPKMGWLIHSCCIFFYVSFPNFLILIDGSNDWSIQRPTNRNK